MASVIMAEKNAFSQVQHFDRDGRTSGQTSSEL
jgi:hypothetical protein